MAANPWKLESIATGDRVFDSARLIYSNSDSPLRFEIVQLETGVEAFLSLMKFKFTSLETVAMEFLINGERFEETAPLLEGKTRLRLPQETTERLIRALQDGREVVMMVDGFERHLDSERFLEQYKKLADRKAPFSNFFKGFF